ncbi:protein RESTRICTED TEV MOVEMENT 3-like isoform X2 [Syzygium oleosum]|uniref:protein RESTRICTED TEV MOVEMENT 3-like isoform X2 n=1 Tax=Syzygium oleosum TaxID=219896 RepID=UPI0024BB000E|nr:protein RESTRICTED TEV MOVEMENT 3-like isoform X2 [Syzygium oleosum]
MSGRRGGCCFSRCGFPSRPPRNTTQVRPVAVPPQPVVVPLSSESELVPCFEGEQAMGEQNPTSWKYTWKITNFTSLTQKKYYSEVFTLRDNAWRILIFPKGNNIDHLSIYLDVADSVELPYGWNRSAHFRMILVDQNNYGYSRIKETEHNFNARESDWGFTSFIPLSEVRDSCNGYLVNNTLTIEAEIFGPQPLAENTQLAEPPANVPQATPTDTFDAYFTNLEEIINAAQSSPTRGGLNASNQKGALLTSEAPTLEEVEKAKLSLKECLSDIFKLNVKDRLAEAMSTLCVAKSGLSLDQQKSVKAFWANFDEFTSDFLTFEQDNAEFELQKLLKDQMYATMKKNHNTHILYKQFLGDLTKEEEELNKKLEEVKSRREKLISDWEILMVESEEAKSGHKDQEKKVSEAEEKKRIAEERMSRSTTAWSNLKTLFG